MQELFYISYSKKSYIFAEIKFKVMRNIMFLFSILLIFVSCETKESRHKRLASDRYFYLSGGIAIHLDSKCKEIGAVFIPHLKSHTKKYKDRDNMYWINGYGSEYYFCTECCDINDIAKFNSQLKTELRWQ